MGNCEYCGKEQTDRICFHCDTAPALLIQEDGNSKQYCHGANGHVNVSFSP